MCSVGGDAWCFSGAHSAGPLARDDLRRVYPHAVALTVSPRLQAELDALPTDVEQLSIFSTGTFDESLLVSLDRPLPQLRELKLIDVAFARLVLTAETAPKLRTLTLQNLPEGCDAVITPPQLRSVSWHYWSGPPEVADAMLAAATQLVAFDSYKFRANESLVFASPALLSIDLHRAELLGELTIWAPQLRQLRLQGCYGLDVIRFPADHPLAAALPPDFRCTAPLEVNAQNANLGPAAKAALRAHPRVRRAAAPAHSGSPMEGLFAMMGGGGGGGGSDW